MPWETIDQIPEQIKTHQDIPLTVAQANKWAEIYDAIKAQGVVENPAAIAWSTWTKIYKVSDDEKGWIEIEKLSVCSECKTHTCTNPKMFSTSIPLLYQFNSINDLKAGESELLMLYGSAIAKGEWKDVVFTADILKSGLERVTNKRIDVEHDDETWEDVKGFIFKPKWNEKLEAIDVSGVIFDERVIAWHKKNPNQKIGFSIKMSDNAKYELINGKKTCTYFDIKGIALTLNPACKVCWITENEVVQLSSSKFLDGGERMVEPIKEDKPNAELKAEKPVEAPIEAAETPAVKPGAETTPPKDEVKAPVKNADVPTMEEFNALKAMVEKLVQENSSLTKGKELSETKAIVDGLINSGQLSEAKREAATKTLLALSSDNDRTAFLSIVGDGNWKSLERGLVLSEGKKDEKPLQFSEPARNVIT
jgi:hypothetical protein